MQLEGPGDISSTPLGVYLSALDKVDRSALLGRVRHVGWRDIEASFAAFWQRVRRREGSLDQTVFA